MMTKGDRSLTDLRPDVPRYGLQAEPMFVAREDFDLPLWMPFGFLGDDVFEVYGMARPSVRRCSFAGDSNRRDES